MTACTHAAAGAAARRYDTVDRRSGAPAAYTSPYKKRLLLAQAKSSYVQQHLLHCVFQQTTRLVCSFLSPIIRLVAAAPCPCRSVSLQPVVAEGTPRHAPRLPLLAPAAPRCRCSSFVVAAASRVAVRRLRPDDLEQASPGEQVGAAGGGRGRAGQAFRGAQAFRNDHHARCEKDSGLTNFCVRSRKRPIGVVHLAVRGPRTRTTLRGPGARVP